MLHDRPKIAAFLYHDVTDDPSESGLQRRSALRYKQAREAFTTVYRQLFNQRELAESLRPCADRIHYTDTYSNRSTMIWLRGEKRTFSSSTPRTGWGEKFARCRARGLS
jgi:hypothetical protein